MEYSNQCGNYSYYQEKYKKAIYHEVCHSMTFFVGVIEFAIRKCCQNKWKRQ
jgi:hypothetical protein